MINGLSFPNLKVLASTTQEDVENTQISLVDITDIYLSSYSGIVGITITSNSNLRLMSRKGECLHKVLSTTNIFTKHWGYV